MLSFHIRSTASALLLVVSSFFPACKSADNADARIAALEKRVETLEKAQPRRPQGPDPSVVQSIPLHDDDVVRGKGKVVIVEAFDFACPYCAMSAAAVDAFIEKHPDDAKVVSKQFVVHPDTATLPALATCAAQKQGKGAGFEHALWQAAWGLGAGNPQPSFDVEQVKQPSLDALAKTMQLDVARFQRDRDGQECKAQIERDQREMAAVGVRGTPSFFLNGRLYNGPRTVEGFEQAVRALQ